MSQYLYGAAVQGIQSFIFESNQLKEIVGASEIVEKICGESFTEFLKEHGLILRKQDYIVKAAGNIRFTSEDKELIETMVKYWPKMVESIAPGLILSQAVLTFNGPIAKTHMDELERMLKVQRNKSPIPVDLASMAVVRSRRTGKAAADWKDGKKTKKPRDRASRLKQEAGNDNKEAPQSLMEKCIPPTVTKEIKYYPFNIEDITASYSSSWLAVIHADGNSLGKIILEISDKLSSNDGNLKKAYSKFSRALDTATINATQKAVNMVCLKEGAPRNIKGEKAKKYPFRPVIVGGDDLTVIIRADLALDFTIEFLQAFREETKEQLTDLIIDFKIDDFKDGLTACAGIAYMKSSYPFHFAVHLAEVLCADAKKASKKINGDTPPSSLSFHKIQDSFIDDYTGIINRELTPQKDLSFKFGPYGFELEGLPSVNKFKGQIATMLTEDAPRSGIRNWLSLLHKDTNEANLWLQRVQEIMSPDYTKKLALDAPWQQCGQSHKEKQRLMKTHLYDVMTLASLMDIKTILTEGKKE